MTNDETPSPPVSVTGSADFEHNHTPPASARHFARKVERELRDKYDFHEETAHIASCRRHSTGTWVINISFETTIGSAGVGNILDEIDSQWEYEGFLSFTDSRVEVVFKTQF